MGDEISDSEKNVTKMFSGQSALSSDEELALDIIHRFNLRTETLEDMPAFEEHLEPLFLKSKEK